MDAARVTVIQAAQEFHLGLVEGMVLGALDAMAIVFSRRNLGTFVLPSEILGG